MNDAMHEKWLQDNRPAMWAMMHVFKEQRDAALKQVKKTAQKV